MRSLSLEGFVPSMLNCSSNSSHDNNEDFYPALSVKSIRGTRSLTCGVKLGNLDWETKLSSSCSANSK